MKKVMIRLAVLASVAGALAFVGGCTEKQKRTALVGGLLGGGLGAAVGAAASGGSAGYALLGGGIGAAGGAVAGGALASDDECRSCKKECTNCDSGKCKKSKKCCCERRKVEVTSGDDSQS